MVLNLSQAFDSAGVRIIEIIDNNPALMAVSHKPDPSHLPRDLDTSHAVRLAVRMLGSVTVARSDSEPEEDEVPQVYACPLMVESRLLGALEIQRKDGLALSEDQESLATMLSSQLAIAALEAKNFNQQQEYGWINTVMLEVVKHATQPGDVESALRSVLQLTTLLAGARWALLLLPTADHDGLVPGPSSGLSHDLPASGLEWKAGQLGINSPYRESEDPRQLRLPDTLETLTGDETCHAFELSDGSVLLGLLLVGGSKPSPVPRPLLAGIAHQISLHIENQRLIEDLALRRPLQRELETAREIQRSFMPETMPKVSGWELFASWDAARQVGGDFYDFIPLSPDTDNPRWGPVIADVADKGAPAALHMALGRTLVRSLGESLNDPAQAIERLNRIILDDSQINLLVSVFMGFGNPHPRSLISATRA